MGSKGSPPPYSANALLGWLRRRSMRVKVLMGLVAMLLSLLVLKFTVKKLSYFYVASEFCHAVGILVLIRKLKTQKTCSGLSLKTQELTAVFLATRFVCSAYIERNIHTVLDVLAFASTAWVIYMMRYKLKSTYSKKMDTFSIYYVLVPCAILAAVIHPYFQIFPFGKSMFAFCVYVESLSVLPQLRLMQNMKIVEPFTAHYVFALGVARFLAWAHWIIQTYETRGVYFYLIGSGYFWILALFLSEIVQSFILIDFCYYYIKGIMRGQYWISMPVFNSPV